MRSLFYEDSPPGWKIDKLGNVATVNPQTLGAGTPPDYRFRYIDISSVERGSVHWHKVREVKYGTAPSRARRVVRGGDVLFGTVRPALQSHGYIDDNMANPLIASTGFAVLRADVELSARFLFHNVLGREVAAQARRLEVGSNYPAINEMDVARIELPVPPLPEQRRIAEILDTIDEAIRKTEQVIAKLLQIKHGLLHDLLTRGLDGNGELRDPERHPEQFKHSLLGRIPKGWEVYSVGKLLELEYLSEVQDGNHGELHPKRSDFVEEGVPFIMAKDLANGRLDLSDCYKIRLSQYKTLRVGFARLGDVLLSHKGTLGETAIVPKGIPYLLLTPQVTYYRLGRAGTLLGIFLLWWFRTSMFHRQLEILAAQSTRAYVGITGQEQLLVPVPLISEQKLISETVNAFTSSIKNRIDELGKLQVIKTGIMDDLLTGRVRVTLRTESVA